MPMGLDGGKAAGTLSPLAVAEGGGVLPLPCGVVCRAKKRASWRSRPDTWSVKAMPHVWAAIRSRWRYWHALFFAVGPPLHLLSRLWAPLAVNTCVFGLVAADHLTEALSAARGTPRSLFPPLSSSISSSLDPVFRLALLAVALLLTLRLGRVYERWWDARRAFSSAGSTVVLLSARALLWGGEALADDVARWGAAWHLALLQQLADLPGTPPAAAALLSPAELALYQASNKPRQLTFAALTVLMDGLVAARPELATPVGELLNRGAAASGTMSGIKLQAMPLAITLTCTGFVELFLATYPLAALTVGGASRARHDTNLASTLFTLGVHFLLYAVVNILFLGADEVANAMEDPFRHFPIHEMAKTTVRDARRVLAETRALAALGGGLGPGPAAAARAAVEAAAGQGGSGGRLAGTGPLWDAALVHCVKRVS